MGKMPYLSRRIGFFQLALHDSAERSATIPPASAREGILPWLWGTENAPEEPAAEPIPDYERFHAAIAETVEALPPKQRTVFEAAWHEHLSYKEIAQRLGIRENTVKAHLYHVRQRLWKRLREWLSD